MTSVNSSEGPGRSRLGDEAFPSPQKAVRITPSVAGGKGGEGKTDVYIRRAGMNKEKDVTGYLQLQTR